MVTTSYGNWCSRVDHDSVSVENTVEEAFGSEGPDGFHIEEIVAQYRQAINEALPDDVSLCGDEFYGPYPRESVDIKALVEQVDLWAIIMRNEEA